MSSRLLTSAGLGALLLAALAPLPAAADPLNRPCSPVNAAPSTSCWSRARCRPRSARASTPTPGSILSARAPRRHRMPARRQRASAGRRAAAAQPRRHVEDPPGQQSAADHRRRASRRQSGAGRQPDQPAHARPHRRAASCGRAERPVRRLRLPRAAQPRQHRLDPARRPATPATAWAIPTWMWPVVPSTTRSRSRPTTRQAISGSIRICTASP